MKKIVALAILASASAAFASDLDRAALEIALANPAVAAQKANLDADWQSERAENVLEGPEAEFEYKWGSEENRWGASVGQAFDWPGLYVARSKAAKQRHNAFDELYRLTVMEKAAEAKEAMLRYAAALTSQGLYAEAACNFGELRKVLQKAYDRGEATIIELTKVEIEQFGCLRKLADAESELDAARTALETLCEGRLPEIDFASLDLPLLKPLEVYSRAMLDANPALAHAEAGLRASQADVSVARRAALPSFKLSYIHDFEENMHFNGFGVAVSLPTWNNKPRLAAAHGRVLAADRALAEANLLASAELAAGYAKAERLQKIVAQASASFTSGNYPALLKKAFDAGRLTIFEYLNEYNAYLEARAAYNEAAAEYAATEARLGRYAIDF